MSGTIINAKNPSNVYQPLNVDASGRLECSVNEIEVHVDGLEAKQDIANGHLSNIDTGIDGANAIQSDFGYRVSLTMDSDGTTGGYTIGESVTQTFTDGTILTGEVAAWSDSDNILHLVNFGADDGAFHLPVTGRSVLGALSANIATPSAVAEELKQNKNEQNDTFETTNDVMSFLDFSETNPFGDVQ